MLLKVDERRTREGVKYLIELHKVNNRYIIEASTAIDKLSPLYGVKTFHQVYRTKRAFDVFNNFNDKNLKRKRNSKPFTQIK